MSGFTERIGGRAAPRTTARRRSEARSQDRCFSVLVKRREVLVKRYDGRDSGPSGGQNHGMVGAGEEGQEKKIAYKGLSFRRVPSTSRLLASNVSHRSRPDAVSFIISDY
jgi:hypothetical protein